MTDRLAAHRGGTDPDAWASLGSLAGLPESGAAVRSRRLAAGLTQRQLAAAAGVSLGALRDLEQGRTSQARVDSLSRLAEALEAATHPMAAERQGDAGRSSEQGCYTEPDFHLAVLGPFEVLAGSRKIVITAPKQRALLALLALHPNSPMHRETLIDALWGQDPPSTAVNLVQSYISRLRRLLDPAGGHEHLDSRISSAGASYRLHTVRDEVDLLTFEQHITAARDLRARGDTDGCCAAYEQALALWRGEPLDDVDVLRAHPAVTGLRNSRASAVLEYAEATQATDRPERSLPHLHWLTGREPLNEKACALLMIGLARDGQQGAALAVYETMRARLDDQLGLRPGPELVAAYLRVIRQQFTVSDPTDHEARPVITPRQLPRALRGFVGRARELKELDDMLGFAAHRGGGMIALIVGAAGIGKTTLAVHWVSRVADQFPAGQIHVNLRGFDPSGTPLSPHAAVRGVLDALGVSAGQVPPDPDAQVGLYRSLLAGRRTVIVLDNACTEDQVRPLLPGSSECLVVVTSRRRLTGLVVSDSVRIVELNVLDQGEARELLSARTGGNWTEADHAAADEIIALCARLPLALAIAGARAATIPVRPLASLAADIRHSPGHLDALDTADPATSIRTVFSWSYDRLSSAAATMFRLLSVHPGPDTTIEVALSLAGSDRGTVSRSLAELVDAHLVTESDTGRLSIHDLLRAYAAERVAALESAQFRGVVTGRMVDYYTHVVHAVAKIIIPIMEDAVVEVPPLPAGLESDELVPSDYASAMAWFLVERQVLIRVIMIAADLGYDAQAWLIGWAIADLLELHGYFEDMMKTQGDALAAAERLGGAAVRARASRTLGRAHTWLRDYDEAIKQLRYSVSLYAKAGDQSGQARALTALGAVFDRMSEPRRSLGCYVQALRLFEAVGLHAGRAWALNSIGWLHAQLGDYRKSIACCQRALGLYKLLDERRGEAHTWDSLAYAYRGVGDYHNSAACYQTAVTILAEIGERRQQAETLTSLADSLELGGDIGAATMARESATKLLAELDTDTGGQSSRFARAAAPVPSDH